jgi:tRNA-specific 2-thiouridylase
MKVLAAMSGGVDSAVAAARMVDAGHDVVGVHLALSRAPGTLRTGSRGCCTVEDAMDAQRACALLGIPFYVWDFSERFQQDVVADFIHEYAAGRTPNPCLRCNEKIKFAALLEKALALGFDAVCTGHYAKVVTGPDGAPELHRAAAMPKDQSYVLGVLTAEQLEHSLFPLGDTPSKALVREEAARRGLPMASKPDSYDICFISDGDTPGWLQEKVPDVPGEIVDERGTTVGRHLGATRFTVGQRRGLHLRRPAADGRPRYVLEVQPVHHRIVVGPKEALAVSALSGERVSWCGTAPDLQSPRNILVQVRAHGVALPARIRRDGAGLRIELEEPLLGMAPGQSAVMYDGDRVLGQLIVDQTERVGHRAAESGDAVPAVAGSTGLSRG